MLRMRISDLPQCLVWKSNNNNNNNNKNNRDTAVDVPIPLSPVCFLFSVLHSCSAFSVRLSSVTRKSPCLGSLGSLLTSFFPHLDSYSLKIILPASLVLASSLLLNKTQINLIEREGGKFSDVMLTFFFHRSPELQVLEIPREREKVICEMILWLLGFL